MTEAEIKVECLKMAMEQARREGLHSDREAIAKIATWFYNLTQGNGNPAEAAKPKGVNVGSGRDKKPGTDKSVFD